MQLDPEVANSNCVRELSGDLCTGASIEVWLDMNTSSGGAPPAPPCCIPLVQLYLAKPTRSSFRPECVAVSCKLDSFYMFGEDRWASVIFFHFAPFLEVGRPHVLVCFPAASRIGYNSANI